MAEPARPIAPLVPAAYELKRIRRETRDTWTLELLPLGTPAPGFSPGQFNMLYAFGAGEIPVSISGDPAASLPLLHTVRAVGSVSRKLCSMARGETVGIRGPFGSCWPLEEIEGCDLLLIAGGIGLAPLRPAIYRVLARRGRYGRVSLLYGTRTPKDLLYRRELHGWRGRFDLDVEVSVDHAAGEPFEHVGVVTNLIRGRSFDAPETAALICGPEIMMRFAIADLLRHGIAPENIWVSMERNMQCAVGHCGHCQFGPRFVCRDGPVFRFSSIAELCKIREV